MRTIYLFICILLVLTGCIYTEDRAGYAIMNFIYSDSINNENITLEIFHGKIDTVKIKEKEFFHIYFQSGKGGTKYFLGYKYSQFDPLTVKRLKVLKNGQVLNDYRLDQLDSLPFEMIDTFKVHKLPVE